MPLEDVLPFIGGSPNAATQALQGTPDQAAVADIAKRLGFPEDTIDRYGDVLGARERRFSDFARDFATGFVQNDPEAATRVKTQVRDQFNQAVDRKVRMAREKKRADIEEAQFMVNSIKSAQELGGANGTGLLRDIFKQAGVEPVPSVMKMMANRDEFNQDMLNQLADMVDKGVFTADEVKGLGANPKNYLDFHKAVRALIAEKRTTDAKLLQMENLQGQIRDRQQRNANPPMNVMINEELEAREVDPQNNVHLVFQGMTKEEVQNIGVRARARAENPFAGLISEALPKGPTRSTTEGVTRVGRGGIKQVKTARGFKKKVVAPQITKIERLPDTVTEGE